MLYQNLFNSDKGRFARRIIMNQKEYMIQNTWYSELLLASNKYSINLTGAETKKKSEWKREVKEKIKKSIEELSNNKVMQMTKLRHQRMQKLERQQYLNETTISRVSDLLRTKLEMMDIGKNLKSNGRKCFACKVEEERTEHILVCNEIRRKITKGGRGELRINSDRNDLTTNYQLLYKR